MLSPQVVQAVQRLQHPPQHHKGAVLIRAPAGLAHVQQPSSQGQNQGQTEEPRDLSAKPSVTTSLPISFLPPGQQRVALVHQQAPPLHYKDGPRGQVPSPQQAPQPPSAQTMARLPPGSSISLTNSVELSPRPTGPEFIQQRKLNVPFKMDRINLIKLKI